jgi:stage II sporulation protein D
MSKILGRNHKYFFLSFLVLFFIGGRPAEFGQEAAFFQGFLIPKPIIRIALGINLEDIHVQAASGMKIYQAAENYKLLTADVDEIRVKGHKDRLNEKFVIQVAQARRRPDAEKIATKLRPRIDRPVSVSEGQDIDLEGIFQVRVGDFITRGDALSFLKTLIPLGFPEAWIIREEITERTSKPLWILINGGLVNLDAGTSLYLIPSNPQSYLTFEGKNYRGIFILRGSARGTILINVLNLEDYLKGVVPGELSPVHFGELEALKAQAIAARTYALRNLGQFSALGFDLYATPQSQVYEGLSIEHPLSSRAVDETRGEVAVYDGKLINALYTSTCGGATENVEEIFGGNTVPYLRSVECLMENDLSWTLKTNRRLPFLFVGTQNASRLIAALAALDILAPGESPEWLKAALPAEEASAWIGRAAAAAGKKADLFLPRDGAPLTPTAFARAVVETFGWRDRLRTLVGKSEAEYVTREIPGLKADDRPLLAYFLISGIYAPSALIDPEKILSRGEAAVALSRVLGLSRDVFHRANLRAIEKNAIVVTEDEETKSIEIGPNPYLLRTLEGTAAFVSALDLEAGAAIEWIESEGQVRLLGVSSVPLSNILDQPSQYHSWQIRMTREDLETRLNQYYPLGQLVDLTAQKRGASKRVVELAIAGQEGRALVTGLKIRQVLNLRDNLFVIDRETDAEGRVTHFLFSGKGWGHGIGLCQVGAFRMAQKGATYETILKKYYHGIKTEKRV